MSEMAEIASFGWLRVTRPTLGMRGPFPEQRGPGTGSEWRKITSDVSDETNQSQAFPRGAYEERIYNESRVDSISSGALLATTGATSRRSANVGGSQSCPSFGCKAKGRLGGG